MSSASPPSPLAPHPIAPPELRIATFDDYPQMAALEAGHALVTQSESDWRRFWLSNPVWPRVKENWPIGWVLENADKQIVGSLLSIPSLYRFRGRELICANGKSWVALPEYRGFALWLMAEYFNQSGVDIFINTTVSALATQAFSNLSDRVPMGDWQTVAYCMTHHRGFAEAALRKKRIPLAPVLAYPAGAALWVKDALGKSGPGGASALSIDWADHFDGRFDLFWNELVAAKPEILLAERNAAAMNWHFAAPMRDGKLWITMASRGGKLRAYCSLKRQDRTNGLSCMRLVDFQTLDAESETLPPLLSAARRRCTAADICMLESVGVGVPTRRLFDDFAPYRHPLEAWCYYYQASDPSLHTELKNPEVWNPSAYDGDASF